MSRRWKNLNDAAAVAPALAHGQTRVWYVRGSYFSDFAMGLERLRARSPELVPRASTITKTHSLLGQVASDDPERIFMALQAEIWSPEGEGSEVVMAAGLSHTTMSVGDVIEVGGALFLCDLVGFSRLTCD